MLGFGAHAFVFNVLHLDTDSKHLIARLINLVGNPLDLEYLIS